MGVSAPPLTEEERRDYYAALREASMEDMAASGAVFVEGQNPYAEELAEKALNMEWPEVCPDRLDDQVTEATYVVAKRNKRNGRVRESTMKRMVVKGEDVRRLQEDSGIKKMKEWSGGPDPFGYGQDVTMSGVNSQFLPLWPGPVTRQLYWQDYWMMSAKAFEAYNHDPISWRMVHLKAEFALGRGLERKVTYGSGPKKGQAHEKAQKVFDEFWKRNKMDQRLDVIARDYCWGGELFLRYFKKGPKLTIRSLDAATIYDLITDPEDIETVFAYHQQFQTAYQLYAPSGANPPAPNPPAPTGPSSPGSITKYIIRQILPQEIDHYKANSSSSERRGRSDLFPALGWIKRLRDYLTAHVIQADMLARICWDLEVAGNQPAIDKLKNLLFPQGRAPQPGTVFAHNAAAKLSAIAPQQTRGSSRGDPVLDAIATMVCLSGGVPKDWMGFGMTNTRAGALVATEPAAKSLQELQGTLELIIHDGFDRTMRAAGINDAELEATFPSIASEDRQQKLDDLGTMEGNGWIAKETAATLAAKEIDLNTFDYATEQDKIAREFPKAETEPSDSGLLGPDGKPVKKPKQGDGTIRRQVILATKRQAPKLDVTQSPTVEDDPMGLAVPLDGDTSSTDKLPAPGSPNGTGQVVPGGGNHKHGVSRGGNYADENPNSARGAKNIRAENTKSTGEAEPVFNLSASELNFLLMRERQLAGRKRPTDPEFQAAAEEYRAESEQNIRQLEDSLNLLDGA